MGLALREAPARARGDGRRVVATRQHGVQAPRAMVRTTVGVKVVVPKLVVVPRRRRAVGLAVVVSTMVGSAMLGAAAFQTQIARRQVAMDQLDSEISSQRETYDDLRRQRAELRSPARLAQIASSTGMVSARDNRIDTLDVSILVAVRQSTGGLDRDQLDDGTTLLERFRVVKALTDGKR